MVQVNSVAELREAVGKARRSGKRVGFVPTMGNLHEGHLSLVDKAVADCDFVVASIFVNPMQFGANEDLDAYPRTLEADEKALESRGCHLLFAPTAKEVYPNGLEAETRVTVPGVSEHFCGESRPGHFTGVATVVAKLFNMVQPDVAVFGEKDFQQLAVIRKMVTDLCFPIEVQGIPTSREQNGLARSSRNGYLDEEQQRLSPGIYKTLCFLKDRLTGAREKPENLAALRQEGIEQLEQIGFKIDYLEFANPVSLAQASDQDQDIVILVAAWLGETRLIDNIVVKR